MNTNLQTKLDQVKLDYLMVGYHLEAISSILNYPKEYELGKKSVQAKACMYDHKIKTLEKAKFFKKENECPTYWI